MINKELLYVLRENSVCYGVIMVFGEPVVLSTPIVRQANLYNKKDAERIQSEMKQMGMAVTSTEYDDAKQQQAKDELARVNKMNYKSRKLLTT